MLDPLQADTDEEAWRDPPFSYSAAAILGSATIGTWVPLLVRAKQLSFAHAPVVLLMASLLATYLIFAGFWALFAERKTATANWSVRIGRVAVWLLLALSPVSLGIAIFVPVDVSLIEVSVVILATFSCGVYLYLAREHFGKRDVA